MVLDAGAFLAVEAGNRAITVAAARERLAGRRPRTHGGVVGQVWRGGRDRQVPVARFLDGVEVVGLDDGLGREAGLLLARSGTRDVIDAAVVLLARDGDRILTSDPEDLALLASFASLAIDIIAV
jgi:hypothetical protein